MTEPEAEYDLRLRRALHAAADSVVPSADGLDRIRQRIAQERSRTGLAMCRTWLKSALADFRYLIADLRASMPVMGPELPARKLRATTLVKAVTAALIAAVTAAAHSAWCAALAVWNRSAPRVKPVAQAGRLRATPAARHVRAAVKSARPAVKSASSAITSVVPQRLRTNDGWLRPLLATAGAVLVAVVAILAIPGLRQTVIPTSNVTSPPRPQQSQPGGAQGPGSQPSATGASAAPGTSKAPRAKSSPTPTHGISRAGCTANPATSPQAGATCPQTTAPATTPASPTQSTSPSPSQTGTGTPSPSPSGSTSPNTGTSSGSATGR